MVVSTFVYDNANVSYSVTVYNMQSVSSNAVAKAMSYSTDEQFTGKYWINGKKIYTKTLDCGSLPNSSQKYIDIGIVNLDTIIKHEGISYNAHYALSIPYVSGSSSYNVEVFYNDGYLRIITSINRSDFTNTYITIEYTKTTD